MWAKLDTLNRLDPDGRAHGIKQFVEGKSYKPAYDSYQHEQ
jgi:hypothetical protein